MTSSLSPSAAEHTTLAELQHDHDLFLAGLARARERAAGEVEGAFGPGSMAWLIFREVAILLSGLAAVLLQIAHPAVAAGVNANSHFRRDVLGRAHRTSTAMYEIVFGDWPTAVGAVTRLHRMHACVRGVVSPEDSTARAGGRYRANAPDLLRWVHATLFQTAGLTFEAIVRPLTPNEWRRYFLEGQLTMALLGIPPDFIPPALEDFNAYYAGMLDGSTLEAGPTARELARLVFASPYTPRPFARLLTAGLLPPRWREAFGLRWTAREQKQYAQLIALMRILVSLSPPPLRFAPAYHQAIVRVARHHGELPPLDSRCIERAVRVIPLPLSLKATSRFG